MEIKIKKVYKKIETDMETEKFSLKYLYENKEFDLYNARKELSKYMESVFWESVDNVFLKEGIQACRGITENQAFPAMLNNFSKDFIDAIIDSVNKSMKEILEESVSFLKKEGLSKINDEIEKEVEKETKH
jgi:hypothetical protein